MFPTDETLELARAAAAADSRGLDELAMCDELLRCEQLIQSARVRQAHLLADLDEAKTCDREFGLPTGNWFAREAGLPASGCRRQTRVALKIRRHLPRVDASLCEGRITWEHAVVIADAANGRIIDHIAACQDELIHLADHADFDWWKRQVKGIADLLDQDGGHDPANDINTNKLQLTKTYDGVHHLSGTLTDEQGQLASHALEQMADELFRRFTRDAELAPDLDVPERATLRALALVELCRLGQAVDMTSTTPPRPEVTLAVHASDPTSATTADGVQLADGTTRTLLCDPDLFPIVVDSLGVPIDMGRRVRYATSHQRRAIALRDGGCVFPGCSMPAHWTDAHHVDEFQHGGATDLDRLAGLCRYHHGVTHRTGWTMEATDDGWFWWRTPSGTTFWSQRHGRRRSGAPPPAAARPPTTASTPPQGRAHPVHEHVRRAA